MTMPTDRDAYLRGLIRDVPDFPKPGIIFKDITTLIKDGEAFRQTIDALVDRYRSANLSKVVGIESRGFIFAGALAARLNAGMVPIRKVGKLPAQCLKQHYDLEYGSDCVEVHADAIEPGERILVIDDLLATGGTLAASCDLLDQMNAEIVELAVVVELKFLQGRDRLGEREIYSLLEY